MSLKVERLATVATVALTLNAYAVPEANVSKLPLTEWTSNTEIKAKFSSEQVFEKISTELDILIKKRKQILYP